MLLKSQRFNRASRCWRWQLLLVGLASMAALACSDTLETGAKEDPSLTDHVLSSSYPEGERGFTVWLPPSYEKDTEALYPVLFHVAFESESLTLVRSVVSELTAAGQIPEMIIVSLHHVGKTKLDDILPAVEGTSHQGKPERFLSHIEKEVVPFVEAHYRASSERVLTGWSRFGIFTTFALTHSPDLFTGFIVRSSAHSGDTFYPILQAGMQDLLRRRPDLKNTFYFTLGTEGNEQRRAKAFHELKDLLQQQAPPSFRWRAERIQGANHMGTFETGLKQGLLFYFDQSVRAGSVSVEDSGP